MYTFGMTIFANRKQSPLQPCFFNIKEITLHTLMGIYLLYIIFRLFILHYNKTVVKGI